MPSFENPPVIEVVCGVQFEPLEGFATPHFGLLWNRLNDQYPFCQEKNPLPPVIETYPARKLSPTISVSQVPPMPRIWYLNEDESQILQVQRDRLLTNWKKVSPEQPYPRYEAVIASFYENFGLFQSFLDDSQLATIKPTQYEMTYVDHIVVGEGWESIAEIGKVLPDCGWRTNGARFLPSPESISWNTAFTLPGQSGRLHIAAVSGATVEDSKPLLQLTITVRGIGEDLSLQGMTPWFDLAHDWIVRAFEDVTATEMQFKVWRKQNEPSHRK